MGTWQVTPRRTPRKFCYLLSEHPKWGVLSRSPFRLQSKLKQKDSIYNRDGIWIEWNIVQYSQCVSLEQQRRLRPSRANTYLIVVPSSGSGNGYNPCPQHYAVLRTFGRWRNTKDCRTLFKWTWNQKGSR